MKITNKLNLPQPFVDAATSKYTYKDRQYSVTSLLKGTCQTILTRRYADKTEQDVSNMVWLIFGTAVHSILEQGQETVNQLKENKIVIDVGEYRLSGIFDLYDAETKTVTDYKTATVQKALSKDWEDYRTQLLIYAYMLRKIGFECDNGEIVALYKDHSKTKAKVQKGYPKNPVEKITFHFTEPDFKKIERFILSKFEDIEKAEKTSTDKLKPCSPKERWEQTIKYAVMKKGRKRALKLCNSKEQAKEYIIAKRLDAKHFIEVRPGKSNRCEEYCSVNQFCPFYKKMKEDN